MNSEQWSRALHAVAVVATAAGTYLAGHKMAAEGIDEQHVAHSQGVVEASAAVRSAVRAELQPIKQDVERMGTAMDMLWRESKRADWRLTQLEGPADVTATADWRHMPTKGTP